MHLEEATVLGATEDSPTSSLSEGSAPGAHLEPPHDPGACHPTSGRSGTHLSSSGLKSCLPSLFQSLLSFISHRIGVLHCTALSLSSLVTLCVCFAYSLIVHLFSKFLSSTCHGKGTVEDQREIVHCHSFQRACYLVGRESNICTRRGNLMRYI